MSQAGFADAFSRGSTRIFISHFWDRLYLT
jgi:hypothetical protein